MDVRPRRELPGEARTLPARYYADPDHFRVEVERFFASMWVCVGRAEEWTGRGSILVREVAGENLILARGEDDRIRGFYNVCRHRGTRLVEAASSCSKRIICPYHAWTFDLDGRLVGAPHMDAHPSFRKGEYSLAEVQTDVWDGHVFVNLDPGAVGLLDQLGELPEKFAAWRMGTLQLAHRLNYDVRANWKLIHQNYSECLHCPVIHPALQKLSHYMSGDNQPATDTYLGGSMDLREGIETMSLSGKSGLGTLPGLPPEERSKVYFYVILPNLLLSLHPDYMLTHLLRPVAADRTEIVCELHIHPDEIGRADLDLTGVIEFWDLTNRQDWHVSELTQLGISSRGYIPGPYTSREDLLLAFDWIVREKTDPA